MNELGKANEAFLFILNFDFSLAYVLKKDQLDPFHLKYSFQGFTNSSKKRIRKKIKFLKEPVSLYDYKIAFNKVKKEINAGNTYLLNLTFPAKINTNLKLKEIFHLSNSKYKLYFNDEFVVFSPETFIQIRNGIISSNPMKGTIDADIPDAEKKIFEDKKESAEHTTIVDLIRNDLNMVADNIHVENFRYTDLIKTNHKNLLQVSSEIKGFVKSDYHLKIGDILSAILPAGSVSGAPKKKTVEIINYVENYKRNFYTGVAGYFDGHNLDSFVMIRFIENQSGKLFFKSGGGITSLSQLKDEYQELIDKIYIPIK